MKKNYQIVLISILILFTSCVSQKKIAYFHGLDEQSAETINQSFKTIHEARVCQGDMLSITVSGIDPEAVAPFNLPVVSYASPGTTQIYASPVLQSYLVDVNGYINFPIIGPIKLAGLTKSQAIQHINELLSPYLKNSIVTIQFLNYKVTVLGEVLRPGQYSINNERVTVLDALGLAGDMTIYGKRENVLLIRENFGKLEFVRLNLNATDLFTSPYYYLQQNDILYVEPNVVRNISAQNIPLYLSTLSTIATLVTVIYSISK
ncbi:MAG TPA: polysaccharide biosynthesis/export family protein [Paludibacteraceae bacterium]|nr:polysaccharide biosynthesis/export family protein [Paludibacteraceae bacterium]HOL00978.1 polysaccharide biosynthesis/export family protein [Paludibacteraceae bacterium]